jgi:anion-transporting  ArsA/GET3 family ATPase
MIVEILDEARITRDYERLERLLYVFLRRDLDDKAAIVQETLIEISKKLSAGEPSYLLAPKLRGFLKICARRIHDEKMRFDARLGDTGDEVVNVVGSPSDDPAVLFARLEAMEEQIAQLRNLRETNPRNFEAFVADAQEISIPEHFREKLGESITPVNARKLRERGRLKLNIDSEQIRKDSSS